MDRILESISLRDAGTALLDMAMPRICVVCRRRLDLRERFICLSCLCDLPLTYFWERSHNPMADRFNERIQESLPLDSDVLEPYSWAAALFFYNSESAFKRIPRHLKYESGISSGRYFSRMLGDFLAQSPFFSDVDLIIPVPLHWTRRWKRGYNQAEIIAKAVAAAYQSAGHGAVVRTDMLLRSRRTGTQTRMSMAEKSLNVAGAFTLRPWKDASVPDLRHILLVDDTFTTGATLNACRTVLRDALGPEVRISVATLAFVNA